MSVASVEVDHSQQTGEKPLWSYLWPWLLMIPMLVFAAGSQFSFQAGAANTAAGGGLTGGGEQARGMRELLILTYLMLSIAILSRYRRVLTMALNMKAVTGLALLAILSAVWSLQHVVSLVRGTYYLIDTLFAYWLVTKLSTARLRTFFMMFGSVVSISSIIMVLALPRYGLVGSLAHLGAWQGIFSEKNHAGGAYLFLLTPAIDFSRRWSWRRRLYTGVVLFLLIMSQSRTAWVYAVLYPLLILILHLSKRLESRLTFLVSFVTLFLTGVVAAVVIPNLVDILLLLGRDPTLTGRTQVWALVVQAIAERPLLGYGFQAFWQGLVGPSGVIQVSLGWGFGYAHDGYLEVLLQVGIVGLAWIAFILLSSLRDAFVCYRSSPDADSSWYFGLILLTIFYNFDEETYLFPHAQNTFMLLIAFAGLKLARRRAEGKELQFERAGSFEDSEFAGALPSAAQSAAG
jgi:O-antigen ligase